MDLDKKHSLAGLFFWLIGIFFLAGLAGIGSINAPDIYPSFLRPSWAPPAAIFGPVWTVLYAMMAVSGWAVWREYGFQRARLAFCLFFTQLLANVLWSWFFFAWQSGVLAFLDIVILLVLLLATITAFWRLQVRLAVLLLLPYLLWVGFAVYLNFTIWQLNPNLL